MVDDARPASAGSAYLVRPDSTTGPGVLVLHSWWGLTDEVKATCEALADAGFVALAPDLMVGRRPETAAEAELELGEVDPNETAALLLSSVVALRSQTDDPSGPVAVVGYSMGGSWAMWLATRQPDSVRRVVTYYGTQDIDFSLLASPVLGHFASDDELVSEDERVYFEAQLRLFDKSVDVHVYDGTHHWFAEAGSPTFDEAASAFAWQRTLDFLVA